MAKPINPHAAYRKQGYVMLSKGLSCGLQKGVGVVLGGVPNSSHDVGSTTARRRGTDIETVKTRKGWDTLIAMGTSLTKLFDPTSNYQYLASPASTGTLPC
jgi:hypothetical protein